MNHNHFMFHNNDNTTTSSNDSYSDGNIQHQQAQEQEMFCQDEMSMTMFMDGFHFSILQPSRNNNNDMMNGMPNHNCLYYFVNTWKLDNYGKFQGAMVFTFLLALLIEGITFVRCRILQYYSKSSICNNDSTDHSSRNNRPYSVRTNTVLRHVLLTICYTVQAFFGYILMLISMSYSVELIASVIGGLMVGNLLFMRYDDETATTSTNMYYNPNNNRSSYRYSPKANQPTTMGHVKNAANDMNIEMDPFDNDTVEEDEHQPLLLSTSSTEQPRDDVTANHTTSPNSSFSLLRRKRVV